MHGIDSTETLAVLRAVCDELAASAQMRAVVQAHCRFVDPQRRASLNTRIHPADPMLWHSLRAHRDANLSVSQYFNVALQQHHAMQQVMRPLAGPDAASRAILDFACGHGRNLRFLALAHPPSNIWACDIQQEAVHFVEEEFGVRGLASTPAPRDFDPGRRFDFIWVASLFSHLPETLFNEWLARLAALLASDGVLCFSVHDEILLSREVTMPGRGFYFVPESENRELDKALYGTTFVTEAFVVDALGRAGVARDRIRRIARGLANEQDLYVVAPRPQWLSKLPPFRRGPWGWVDRLEATDRHLLLEGWAGSLDDGALDAVEVRIDGQLLPVPLGMSMPAVAAVLGDERLANSGFVLRHEWNTRSPRPFVDVAVRTQRGESALVYAGPVRRRAE
jgi:SAM-dependent methyltransferase